MHLFNGIKMAPTKKILCLSLFELLESEKLDNISTKAIYETAGVSANSFYYHFRDKYDCASYLFRVILIQAMDGPFRSPDDFFKNVSNDHLIQLELQQIQSERGGGSGSTYIQWMEKWYGMWYTMAKYVRDNARAQFLNIYDSRSVNSPYFELRAAWDKYFASVQSPIQFQNEKQKNFLKEALFAFFELYLRNFALNPDYDFQRSDAMRLMKLRRKVYETCLESFETAQAEE